MSNFSIQTGFADDQRSRVAELYWQAFEGKLGRVMGQGARAVPFIAGALDPRFAVVAVDPGGIVLGVAGFRTDAGGMTGWSLRAMMRSYGWFGGLWRGLVLSLLESTPEPGIMPMDGICVSSQARGQGVGTALLDGIRQQAVLRGYRAVELHVIDSNPKARALYERVGFHACGTAQLGPLRHIFGFSKATAMRHPITPTP